jgi:hypothetical protein
VKPKIWGDVSKSAIAQSEIRKQERNSTPFQASTAGGAFAQSKDGSASIIIPPEEKEPDKPTFYVHGKRGSEDGRMSYGSLTMPLRIVRHGTILPSGGRNQPAVYGGYNGIEVLSKNFYLGNGRIGTFTGSGYHFCQRNIPEGNFFNRILTGTDGAGPWSSSVVIFGMENIGDPSSPPFAGFNSGTTAGISVLTSHSIGAKWPSGGFSGVPYHNYTTSGAYSAQDVKPVQYCPLGIKTDGTAAFSFSTIMKSSGDYQSLPRNQGAIFTISNDGVTSVGQFVTMPAVFSEPVNRFLGPMVATAPGHAICIMATGAPAIGYGLIHRYKFNGYEAINTVRANSYGVYYHSGFNEHIDDAFPAALNAIGCSPEQPNIAPGSALKLAVFHTSDWGATWGMTEISYASLVPHTMPYLKVAGSYKHSSWRYYDSNGLNATPGLPCEYRPDLMVAPGAWSQSALLAASDTDVFKNWNYGYNDRSSYIDSFASLLELSSICVSGVDTVVWFYQTFKGDQVITPMAIGDVDDLALDISSHSFENNIAVSTNGGISWARVCNPATSQSLFGSYELTPSSYPFPWVGQVSTSMLCLRPGVVLLKVVKHLTAQPGGRITTPAESPVSLTRPVKFLLSEDHGSTWTVLPCTGLSADALSNNGLCGKPTVFSASATKSKICMFAGTREGDGVTIGMYVSNDDGYTWEMTRKRKVVNDGSGLGTDTLMGSECPTVGWEDIMNFETESKGYCQLPGNGQYEHIMFTGEKLDAPADMALPWRLDARIAMP